MIRSTLILIPLFGVYYVISVTMPDCMDDRTEIVWLYVESIINSFQVSIFKKKYGSFVSGNSNLRFSNN